MARILFVDDDSLTLQLLDQATRILGHDPIYDPSAKRAIKLAAVTRPDLIIVDLSMMEMSGSTMVRRLREQPETAHIPVLILSAAYDSREKQAAIDAGAADVLDKPINLGKLEQVINHYLGAPSGSV
ncbi:MAG TPA: response regulator [Anaerolineaceae bacterium]|nr:response regulator [Anaerolineaceae bacterium]